MPYRRLGDALVAALRGLAGREVLVQHQLEAPNRPPSILPESGTIFEEPGDTAFALPGFELTLPDELRACSG